MNLIDCTNALGVPLMYDRSDAGYGVPVAGVKFKGTQKLYEALEGIGRDLKQIGWLQYVESVLTAGLYVKKPGGHGDGTDIDIDGALLKTNPLLEGRQVQLAMMCNTEMENFLGSNPRRVPLHPRIYTRLACLFSLRFPEVLTAGYNAAHIDHYHLSIAGEVGWRGSRSQVVCLQETLNAWYDAGLKVDGRMGEKTFHALRLSSGFFNSMGLVAGLWLNKNMGNAWLDWLKMIAFDPPIKDGA